MNSDTVVIETKNITTPEEGKDFFETRSNVYSSFYDRKIELTIAVFAFNKLEKTKKCIEYLLKYTNNINFNLILCDNGSTDDTLNFFESINFKNKVIVRITKNMGIVFAMNLVIDMINTKYCSLIANDGYVTENCIYNLLKCIKSDYKIGYVAPLTSNMSNYQDPGYMFNNLDEMQEFASKYNKSDRNKWQEKKRLLGVVNIYRREIFDIVGRIDYGFNHAFSDDDHSLRISRSGYKQILCGDTYAYHDHDLKSYSSDRETFFIGREQFKKKYYGIDPWSAEFAFIDSIILSMIYSSQQQYNKILGIDSKCGTMLLEIKNKLKGKKDCTIELQSFIEEAKYYGDLCSICEGNVYCDRINYVTQYYNRNYFDYIYIEKYINYYSEPLEVIVDSLKLLKVGGQLLIKLHNCNNILTLFDIMGISKIKEKEYVVNIGLEDLCDWIIKLGGSIDRINKSFFEVSDDVNNFIERNVTKEMRENIIIREFYISIKKEYDIGV